MEVLMKKLILLLILCFCLLLSSNIFALPFSYNWDVKNGAETIIYLKSGDQLNLSDVLSNNQEGVYITYDNSFLNNFQESATSTENSAGDRNPGVSIALEPLTLILFSMGLAGIAIRRRKH
jgi:hypothetical protein